MSLFIFVFVLIIVGFDFGGGVGIQVDLKVFVVYCVYGLLVIVVLIVQNICGVIVVYVFLLEFLQVQIDVCFVDFEIYVVKLGMLVNVEVIGWVVDVLEIYCLLYVVFDLVMVVISGVRLLEESVLYVMCICLILLVMLLMFNILEVELLFGCCIVIVDDVEDVVGVLLVFGVGVVLFKGGYLDEGVCVIDCYFDGVICDDFIYVCLLVDVYGIGCMLVLVIVVQLCQGLLVLNVCEVVIDYVVCGLQSGYYFGCSEVLVIDYFGVVCFV